MNLRILKKLSKRVAPLIAEMVKDQDYTLFKAEYRDNYTNTYRHDRKHWERDRYPTSERWSKEIVLKPYSGAGFIHLSQQYLHPWKNTEMIGWTYGWETPEWEEETTWDYFRTHVFNGVGSYEPISGTEDENGFPDHTWVLSRKLNNPSDYLQAFAELLEQNKETTYG